MKKWKLFGAVALANCMLATPTTASLMTYNFTVTGFENACADITPNSSNLECSRAQDAVNDQINTITGSFTGMDRNGDGYLSSYGFANPSNLAGTPFEIPPSGERLSEIESASFTLTGRFTEGVDADNGIQLNPDGSMTDLSTFLDDPVTSYTVNHDLSLVDFENFFFLLNYKLDGSGILGNDQFEGLFMGNLTNTIFFALGQFLPASFPGETVTSQLLGLNNPEPCKFGGDCGVLHSIAAFDPNINQFEIPNVQRTASFAIVTEVSAPPTILLSAGLLLSLLLISRRDSRLSHKQQA